jgi:hypothetical protein
MPRSSKSAKTMIRLTLSLMLAACAATPERAPFSVDALVADAPAYVASRYARSELPAALIADLTALDFRCQHSATMSECGSAQHAVASCFDVVTVRISAETVTAERNRRCMGVQQ